MQETLKDIEKIKSALLALDISTVLSASCGKYQKTEVHILEKDFKKNFKSYETRERNCSDYPLEVSFMYNGVKFYALVREKRKEL